ncbi:nucleoredoxin [Lingula anatina]|uniref:Nucleoredoxin n=1 Tax=Lingula anatina TaxID=7574 RepID=A0A1S3IYS8_LINAN|nr:nucleoredoxin [Lingula anatina]|eukprot:XP_013403357.1 nucleoredoxin [Lingula anatina]
MAGAVQKLLGDKVVSKDGEVSVSSFTGDGKVVGLYFSAHWCPPCRGFTPVLATFYEKFKKTDKGKDFEIVFVSSDRDENSFNDYFKEMPWLALPFAERDLKGKLSKEFKVSGIPTLILLNGATGKVITSDGRSVVTDDPEGQEFPWNPKPFKEIMKGELLAENGGKVDAETALAGKVKAIYFSAHWCPPCRGFTPKLIETYKKLKAANKNFEIVFASSDREEDKFKEYFATMPWLAIPFKDVRATKLNKTFGIEGIPSLIILDEDNKVINKNGRSAIASDPEGKDFPWKPKPIEEMTESSVGPLNDSPCMILLTEGKGAALAQEVMSESAKEYYDKGEDQDVFFLWMDTAKQDELYDSLINFCKLEERLPLLALTDFPEQRVFASPEKTITKAVVQEVISQYKAGNLEWKKLQG